VSEKKVVILPSGELYQHLFPKHVLAKLEEFSEVAFNLYEGDITEEQAIELLQDADGVITSWGSPMLTEKTFGACPRLKIIGHAAGSALEYAKNAIPSGVKVVNAASAIASSVAEYCLCITLASLRTIKMHDLEIKEEKDYSPSRREGTFAKNYGLFNKKVGLVGFGYVAREFTKLLKPFQVEITVYDPYISDSVLERFGVRRASSLVELFRDSKIISVHLPPKAELLIGRAEFAAMSDGGIFINSSNGLIFDPEALLSEIKSGRIFAAIDNIDSITRLSKKNPVPEMVEYQNLILTPHVAGPTIDQRYRLGLTITEEFERFFAQKPMLFEIKEAHLAHNA
jgi:phosphoglycerate dehydrogenase-like enzyme